MKILFITHDASRSGAPLVLLYYMRWLKQHRDDVDMDMLFVRGGVMETEFNKITTNSFNYTQFIQDRSNHPGYVKKIKKALKISAKAKDSQKMLFYKNMAQQNYDVIYANTIISTPHGFALKSILPKATFILHIHELQTIIKTLLPDFNSYISKIDRIIAASHQVKQNLVSNWNMNAEMIDVVYECTDVNLQIHQKKSNDFIIGASGLSYWRKGNDVFIQVARYVTKNHPDLNIKFKWVGNEYHDKPIIEADIDKLGLRDTIEFLGEVSQPEKIYNEFDVFLMVSREDPFPLVCIEVAQLKKPIICFEKASGTAEVIEQGGGFVVPYLDIEAVGEKIIYYYNNRDVLLKDGNKACELFLKYRPEHICPRLFDVMMKPINE